MHRPTGGGARGSREGEVRVFKQNVRDTISALRLGAPISDGALSILPLRSTAHVSARYVLLGQAVSRGTLAIAEVSDAGSVPNLQAVNQGPWPVLIFDGEELVGAKQNRIANTTILVGVGKTILPVSCVEEGRWSHRTPAFRSGEYASHPGLRRAKERQVRERGMAEASRRAGSVNPGAFPGEAQHLRAERFGADQGRVWGEVARTARLMKSKSPTMAMADTYETAKDELTRIVQVFQPDILPAPNDTVGALVFIADEFVCLDLLQPAKRFLRLYPKLLRGYAFEALLHKVAEPKEFDAEASALRLFAEILEAKVEDQAAVDLGRDLRLETKRVSGAGLVWEQELIQLSIFPRVAA